MFKRAQAIADDIVSWRRHIHQYPELSFQEIKTARFVVEHLEQWGIQVQAGVAKTGVIGTLGSGSPVIALRADMDALPIQEKVDVPFASKRPGIMHACGHDTHVACLLGAAKLLAETPPEKGQIRFLFQPSEEGVDEQEKSGAMRMVEEGAMEGVDAVVGLHIWSNADAGIVSFSNGPQMAAAGKWEAKIWGKGGHGAMPHQTVDPIVLTAQVILALQTIVARRIDPIETGVVTVGTIQGGTRDNIIPEYVDITGTIRALDDAIYQQIKTEIERTLEIVKSLGGNYDLVFRGDFPVTYNDSTITDFVRQIAVELFGNEAVQPATATMGGEDFSILAQNAPGCFIRLGGRFPGQETRNHHDPHFEIDESALPMGTALLAEIARRYLTSH